VELRLERLSPEMEFATITAWLKAEGDPVAAGEVIAEIEADKVAMELESPVAGVLAEIVAVAGDEIAVEALVAVIRTEA
jgi:2-oxoglutarate dehydrogenase E2 component (dihydrolipoamide succinyltransferase)